MELPVTLFCWLAASAMAVLAAFAPSFRSLLRVVLEIASATLTAFFASLGSTLPIVCEITCTTTILRHNNSSFFNIQVVNLLHTGDKQAEQRY